MTNLFEYQNREVFPGEDFKDLEIFLDEIWSRRERSSFFVDQVDQQDAQRFVQFFHKSGEIKSNKYVGVIHFGEHTINLLPKIFHRNEPATAQEVKVVNFHVLWWLSYCRKLKFPNYLSGLQSTSCDFFEILIYLFSKYTRELLHSAIYQQYVEMHNQLSNVKGRVDFSTYVRENLATGRLHKVPCVYDSLELDNAFNQCIKFVSRLLLRATKDIQNKRYLNDILYILDEVSDCAIGADQCRKLSFSPVFRSFETVRDYCILFLENSVSFNYKNDLRLFAFLLPMEYVFEDFVFGFIDKELPGLQAKAQTTQLYLDRERIFGLKPDLLFDFGEDRRIIADTKYKFVYSDTKDKQMGISQADLYQMLAYAVRFKTTAIKLFYPNSIQSPLDFIFPTLTVADELAGGVEISINLYELPILNAEIKINEIENKSLSEIFCTLKETLITVLEAILSPPLQKNKS